MMHKDISTVAFTIVNGAYLHLALVLAHSFVDKNPDCEFIIYLLDSLPSTAIKFPRISVVEVDDKLIADIQHRALYYEITELSTSIKPDCMLHLIKAFQNVIYLDPDIYVTSDFSELRALLDVNNIVITPHSTTPIYDGKMPDDLNFLRAGTYNLGFIAVSYSEETVKFLNWWSQRLKINSFNSFSKGMFTDQKWIDLVPSYFEGVYILKNPGYNVAYWNLHERSIEKMYSGYTSNKEPLVFFHFSGIDLNSNKLSKYSTRYGDFNQEGLGIRLIFNEYLSKLLVEKDKLKGQYSGPYKFNIFKDEQPITEMDRMLYFYYYLDGGNIVSPFELTKAEFKQMLNRRPKGEMTTFTRDKRIESFADKVVRLPSPMKLAVRKVSEQKLVSKVVSLSNNAYNKLNVARLFYAAYEKGKE